ncbi:amino acid adenylation domain-containing protein [Kroppenstedtia pulmonis]|uniref:Amino acid adenylation domain-containing protein n=1 Tax=Kroppenstedtia pulmonis TaxID=1380685 RepID=A0A7D4C5F5_9BACL|nr:non-ribosomal peptide synthetase [Kroppenstedtia pulmonis]QKG83776.1 amino acid adenylation domain-containing protein [Kroppenstedtia pulmonis]
MKVKNLEDIYELTPIQHGFLFHFLYNPGSGVYIEHMSFTFKGDFDRVAFRRAWENVMQRHPILRTSFHAQEIEKPVQAVHRKVELPLDEWDWTTLSSDEQERRYRAFLQEDRARDFDFTKPPLMRLTLIQMNEDTVRFAWRFPHLVMDGWSFGLALSEFFVGYKAYRRGESPDMPPARAYRDYVSWWKRQNVSETEAFWREALQDFEPPDPLDLGEGDVIEDGATHHWEQITNEEIADQLKQVAREGKLTMNTIVQAAWAIVLGRYLGVDDVVAGSTIAHQPSDLLDVTSEAMMGPMIVTLPVRAKLNPDDELLSWLQQFQVQQAAIRTHSNASLVQIQQWSDAPQSSRLFESTVTFENVPLPSHNLQGEGLELLDVVYDGRPHYPLTLIILPGDELPLRMVYDRRRFNHAAVRRILGNLQAVLRRIADNPRQHLRDLEVLTEGEHQQLVEGWQPVVPQPADRCLHQIFSEQAARTPDAIALTFEGESLTYGELDRVSNRLARSLQKRGVGPDTPVGLCVERSMYTIVGIIGILKAGAPYVPLDPVAPQERLSYIAEDSGSQMVVTESALLDKVESFKGEVLCLDKDREEWEKESAEQVTSRVTPGDLAYVMYTSGSTGRPKGTLVTHGNIVRLISGVSKIYSFSDKDVWTLFHTYAFDVSVGEIWGALLNGGKLVIVPYWLSRSPDAFYDLLHREKVTVLTQTPSAFEQLIAYEEETPVKKELALRYVLFIGERLDMESLKPWIRRHGDTYPQLINTYGPTETSVYVTHRRITAKDLSKNKSFIGYPLPDLKIYLLDKQLRPVPIGAMGEICVAGPAVAKGYLNRPQQTNERFVPDPFSKDPGARIYRTGDLGRFGMDGDLEFCGRADDQVKIRGYRVELGEIEMLLRAHSGVNVATVMMREDVAGDKRLVAYLVPSENPVSITELRGYLREKLPEYMVPSAFVEMEKMPLTANGKLDRRALPRPEGVTDETGYVAPRTETEKVLTEILADILSVEKVGIQDNLLDRGLHSLMAIRVIKRIHEKLKVDIPLRALFESPTVEALVRMVEGGEMGGSVGSVNSVNLKDDVVLDPDIQPVGSWEWNPSPKQVFLTGATGFLGGFLLAELLQSTSARIFCLVRSKGVEEGKKRLRDHLLDYGLWRETYDSRIIPIPGDLSQPLLGLDSKQFDDFALDMDEVYHCAAQVNFLLSYEHIRTSNIRGTEEILRLASSGKVKPLHYVSTVGTVGLGHSKPVMEKHLTDDPPEMNSGYAKSKWVAERMVLLARDRGLPVAIYRPGRVTGHSTTGVWKTDDAVCQIIRALTYLKTAPDVDLHFDLVPVDYVSSVITLLARRQESVGNVFHVTNPRRSSMRDLITGLSLAGYKLKLVSFEEWDASLGDLSNKMPDLGFDTTRALFSPWVRGHMSGKHEPEFDCSNTFSLLNGQLECPPIDDRMIQTYLSYLAQIGYIRDKVQANI